jgi:hypothetical protein
MKRTAATIVMLAGLGGCASPDADTGPRPFGQAGLGQEVPGVVGPTGEPINLKAAGQMPTDPRSKVVRADMTVPAGKKDTGVRQMAGFARMDGGGMGGGIHTPGLHGGGCADGNCGPSGPPPWGPMNHGFSHMIGHGGILPVPGMGPPGAVAAVGALGAHGGMYGPIYANQRTSIRFASPAGMTITWQGPGGQFVEPAPLQAAARYNFPQGNIYRLRLSGIPTRPGKVYYPTLEVYPATPTTVTFLSHATVPVSFTDDDFEQVNAGNLVVKVIYLPFPQFQDLAALAGAEEIVSTRLEPGVNPVEEAHRRGTILAVIRIGNIDLQDPNTPAMDAPPAMLPGGPGMAPPRVVGPLPHSGHGAVPSVNPNMLGDQGAKTLAVPVAPAPKAPATAPAPLPSGVKGPSVPSATTGAVKAPTSVPAATRK